jgi:hypothetical protein
VQSVLKEDASLAVELPEDHKVVLEEQEPEPEPEHGGSDAPAVEEIRKPTKVSSTSSASRTKKARIDLSDEESADDLGLDEESDAEVDDEPSPPRASKSSKAAARPVQAVKAPSSRPEVTAVVKRPTPQVAVALTVEDIRRRVARVHPVCLLGHVRHESVVASASASSARESVYKYALWQLEEPPAMVAGQIVAHKDAAQYKDALNCASVSVRDIPAVPVGGQLRWTLAVLRDPTVQGLLRKQFALRIKDLVNQSRDTRYLKIDSHEVVLPTEPGQFAAKVQLPATDPLCRNLFQLCQMALTYEHRIDVLDEVVLRVYVPLVIKYVLQTLSEQSNTATATSDTKNSASASASGQVASLEVRKGQLKTVMRGVFTDRKSTRLNSSHQI